jgi:hypothetical protein
MAEDSRLVPGHSIPLATFPISLFIELPYLMRQIYSRIHQPLQVLMFFCLTALNAASQTNEKILVTQKVPLERFSERFSDDVPVSGRILVGAYALTSKSLMSPQSDPVMLWGEGISSTVKPNFICVTTTTRDGRYFSEGNLSQALLSRQPGPFRIESVRDPKNVKHLQSLSDLAVAQVATDGDCEIGSSNSRVQKVFLLSRQHDGEVLQPNGAVLLINSERLNLQLEFSGKNSLKSTCDAINDGMRSTFDTICKIDGLLPSRTQVKLLRKRYEKNLPPIELEILWASK